VAPVPLGACFYCLIEARYRAIRRSERASRSPASGKANPIDAGHKPRVPLRYTVKVILHLLHIFGSSAHAGSYFSLEGAQSQDIENRPNHSVVGGDCDREAEGTAKTPVRVTAFHLPQRQSCGRASRSTKGEVLVMRCLTPLSQSLSMRVSGGSRSIANPGLTHGISCRISRACRSRPRPNELTAPRDPVPSKRTRRKSLRYDS